MEIQDTPVDMEVEDSFQAVEDTPISGESFSPRTEAQNKFIAMQSAFMDNYLNGTPVSENFVRYSEEIDPEQTAKELARSKAEADSQALAEQVMTNPAGITGDIGLEIDAAQQANKKLEGNAEDVDLQFTESAMGGDATLEEASYEANKIKMWKMLGEWQQDLGITDKGIELGKQFFAPVLESWRGIKVTGEYFGAKEEFQSMIRAFQNKPIEEQVAILPVLKKELEDKVGNVDAVNLLTSFIDPLGDSSADRYGSEEVIWDLLDASGVGYALMLAVKGIGGSVNAVKTLKSLKNYEASEEAAAISAINPDIAEAMGLDELAAVSNILPYDTSIEVIGREGGLANKALKKLEGYFNEADAVTENINKAEGYLKEQTVSNKYRKQLEDAVEKKFQTEQAENIRIVGKDETGTVFEYQALDESGELTDKTYRLSLDLDSAGNFGQSTMGLIREYVGSPTAFARGMLAEDVKTAQRVDYLNARINKHLTDLTSKALKPIGLVPTPKTKAALARVDKALREGDEWKNADGSRGHVFSVDELRTKFGLDTDNEVSAYYRINRLYNNLWHIRNNEKRAELDILGYKNVNFSRNGDNAIGKHYENALTARSAMTSKSISQIYDSQLDEILDFNSLPSDYMAKAYEEGKVFIRMDEPYDIGGDRGLHRYALVDKEEVGDLPRQVLARKTGYVPRIYEDAVYFVKERKTIKVDGDKEYHPKSTLRFFDNKKDADIFREDLIQKAMRDKGLDRDKAEGMYVRLSDREEEQLSMAAGEISHGSSGLYSGARAEDAILFGLNGDKANRVNSFESLIKNVGNVAKYTSMNKWRLGLEQRWINSANEIFKAKGQEARIESFKRLPKESESSPEVRFLNRVYDQIRDWQGFATPSEQFFSNTVRQLMDFTSGKDLKRTSRFLGNFKDADPVAAARATAFHTLLGFANPAHAWIQAQGAATALSLGFGKYMTQTLRNTSALTMLGYGAKNPSRYSLVAKANLMGDTSELEAMHKLWLKTGYEDSVLQTADYAAASKGYGMSMAVFKRVADNGLFFYKQGEFFNRRMAFTTALERWKESNKVKTIKNVSDSELKDIMDDANAIMLGMSKANRAPFQKGVLSLPSQFLQVTTKSIETMTGLNKHFSPQDRGRLIFGQLALYGTADIPLVSIPTMIATELFGMDQQDIEENPVFFKTLNDGFWGMTTMNIFGADLEVSSRGSLLKGVSDFIDNWFVRESSFTEKALGAFGSSGNRFWEDFTRRLRPMTISNMSEIDFEDIGALIVSPAFKTLSTYNNLEKAYIMEKLDAAYSRSGKLVAEGFSFGEVVGQALGFQPTKVTDTYDLMARTRYLKKFPEKIASDILIQLNNFAAWHPDGNYTEEQWRDHRNHISILYSTLDPDQQADVRERIGRAMMGDSQRDRAIQEYVRLMKHNTTTDLGVVQQLTLGNKSIRIGINAEGQE